MSNGNGKVDVNTLIKQDKKLVDVNSLIQKKSPEPTQEPNSLDGSVPPQETPSSEPEKDLKDSPDTIKGEYIATVESESEPVDVFGLPQVNITDYKNKMMSVLKTVDREALILANDFKKGNKFWTPAERQGIQDKFGLSQEQILTLDEYLKPKPNLNEGVLMNAIKRGQLAAQQADLIPIGGQPIDLKKVAEVQSTLQNSFHPSKAMQDFHGEKGWKTLINPLSIGTILFETAIESMVPIVLNAPEIAAEGGKGALVGGGAGTALPGVGTAAGATIGLGGGIAAGMGIQSAAQEYSAGVLNKAQELGYDTGTEEGLKEFFARPDIEEIMRKQEIKAGIVGTFDMISGVTGGKLFTAAKGVKSKAAAYGKETLLQGALGGAGAATGSAAIGEIPSGKEVFLEILGEGATAPFEVASGGYTIWNRARNGQATLLDVVQENPTTRQIQAAQDMGYLTKEQGDDLLKKSTLVQEAEKSVPPELKDNKEIVALVAEKKELEAQKGNVDPIFHEQFNEKTKAINEQIKQLMKPDLMGMVKDLKEELGVKEEPKLRVVKDEATETRFGEEKEELGEMTEEEIAEFDRKSNEEFEQMQKEYQQKLDEGYVPVSELREHLKKKGVKLTKEQDTKLERLEHGGLTNKQHEQMIESARKENEKYREFLKSKGLTIETVGNLGRDEFAKVHQEWRKYLSNQPAIPEAKKAEVATGQPEIKEDENIASESSTIQKKLNPPSELSGRGLDKWIQDNWGRFGFGDAKSWVEKNGYDPSVEERGGDKIGDEVKYRHADKSKQVEGTIIGFTKDKYATTFVQLKDGSIRLLDGAFLDNKTVEAQEAKAAKERINDVTSREFKNEFAKEFGVNAEQPSKTYQGIQDEAKGKVILELAKRIKEKDRGMARHMAISFERKMREDPNFTTEREFIKTDKAGTIRNLKWMAENGLHIPEDLAQEAGINDNPKPIKIKEDVQEKEKAEMLKEPTEGEAVTSSEVGKSILNQETDLKGDKKERWQLPKEEFVSKLEDEKIEGFGKSKSEFIADVEEHLSNIDWMGKDVDVTNIKVIGSRKLGTSKEGSDLDILIEYDGKVSEDKMHDILNHKLNRLDLEDINGKYLNVDFFPIKKTKGDFISKAYKKDIKESIEQNKYQTAISEGRMTAQDAKTIIESAGLEVPKDILEMAGKPVSKPGVGEIKKEVKKTENKDVPIITKFSNNAGYIEIGTLGSGGHFVNDINIKEAERGRGNAGKLIKQAINDFPNLTATTGNPSSIKAFYKQGFAILEDGKPITLDKAIKQLEKASAVSLKSPQIIKEGEPKVKPKQETEKQLLKQLPTDIRYDLRGKHNGNMTSVEREVKGAVRDYNRTLDRNDKRLDEAEIWDIYKQYLDALDKPTTKPQPKEKEVKTGKEIEPRKEVKDDLKTVAKELGYTEGDIALYEKLKELPKEQREESAEKFVQDAIDAADERTAEVERLEQRIEQSYNTIARIQTGNLVDKTKKARIEKEERQKQSLKDQLKEAKRELKKEEALRESLGNYYTKNGVVLLEGADLDKMIDRIEARLQTRKNVKAGTDLFPESSNIPELNDKITKANVLKDTKIADNVKGAEKQEVKPDTSNERGAYDKAWQIKRQRQQARIEEIQKLLDKATLIKEKLKFKTADDLIKYFSSPSKWEGNRKVRNTGREILKDWLRDKLTTPESRAVFKAVDEYLTEEKRLLTQEEIEAASKQESKAIDSKISEAKQRLKDANEEIESEPQEIDEDTETMLQEDIDAAMSEFTEKRITTNKTKRKEYGKGFLEKEVTVKLKGEKADKLKQAITTAVKNPTKENKNKLYDVFNDIYGSPYTGSNQVKAAWKQLHTTFPELKSETDKISEKILSLKIDTKGGQLYALPFPPQIWNAFVDVVHSAFIAGKELVDAIADGVAWLKGNHPTENADAYGKEIQELYDDEYRMSIKDAQKRAKKVNHVSFNKAVKEFASINPKKIPDNLKDAYLKALDNLATRSPKYEDMVELFYQIQALNQKQDKYSSIDTLEKAEKAWQSIWENEIKSVEDYRNLFKDINALKRNLNRMLEEGDITQEQFDDLMNEIGNNQAEVEKKFESEILSLKTDLIGEIRSKPLRENPDFTKEENALIRKFNELNNDDLRELSPENLYVLNDLVSNIQDGEFDLFRFSGILSKAATTDYGKQVAEQASNTTLKSINKEQLQNEIAEYESSFWEGLLGLGRITSGAFQKFLISPFQRAIASYESDIKDGYKEFLNLKKKYKIDEKSMNKLGMASTYIQEYMAQFDPKWKGVKNLGQRDWFKEILSNPDAVSNYQEQTLFEKGKKLLGGAKSQIDQIRDIHKQWGNDVKPEDVYNSVMANDGKFLTESEKAFLDAVQKWKEDNLTDKQRAANELRGQAFEEVPFHMMRIRLDPDSRKQVAPRATGTEGVVRIEAGTGKERTSQKIEAVDTNFETAFIKGLEQTSRDYHLGKMLQDVNNTLASAKKQATDATKPLINVMSNILSDALNYEFDKSPSEGVFKTLLASRAAMTLIDPIRTGIELAASAISYPIRGKTIEGYKDVFSRKKFIDLLEFTESPLRLRGNINKAIDVERGSIKPASKMERAMIFLSGLPERTMMGTVWQPTFDKEFKELTGQKFDYDNYNDAYKEKYGRAIKEAAAVADAQTEKIIGTTTKAGQRKEVRIAPKFLAELINRRGSVRKDSIAGQVLGFFSNYPYREISELINGFKESAEAIRQKDPMLAAKQLQKPLGVALNVAAYGYLSNLVYNLIASSLGSDDEKEKAEQELESLTTLDGFLKDFAGSAVSLAGGKYSGGGRAIIQTAATVAYSQAKTPEEKAMIKKWLKDSIYLEPLPMDTKYKGKEAILASIAKYIPQFNVAADQAISAMGGIDQVKELYENVEKNGIESLSEDEKQQIILLDVILKSAQLIAVANGTTIPMYNKIRVAMRGIVHEEETKSGFQKMKIEGIKSNFQKFND